MLLLDTSFLVKLEEEISQRNPAAAWAVLDSHRREAVAISLVASGEFAKGFDDLPKFNAFISRFQVASLCRSIAWRTAMLQTSLSQRLGENDAWIAATALAYNATLVGRDACFARVPRLQHLKF